MFWFLYLRAQYTREGEKNRMHFVTLLYHLGLIASSQAAEGCCVVDKCSVTVCVVSSACYACLPGVARLSNNALCLCDLVTYFYSEGKVLSHGYCHKT